MLKQIEKTLYEQVLIKEVSVVTRRLQYFFISYGLIFIMTFALLVRTLHKLSYFYQQSLEIYG